MTFPLWALLFIAGFSSTGLAAQIAPNVRLDTDVRLQALADRNADLGTDGIDSATAGAVEARLRLTADLSANTLFFWDGRAVLRPDEGAFQSADTGSTFTDGSFLEWRQSYFQFNNVGSPSTSFRVGRQKVREEYGLWWNQDFDAARMSYDTTLFKGSLIGGENLFSYRTGDGDLDENAKDLALLMAEGSWQYYYEHFFEARIMLQNDHSGIEVGDVVSASNPDDREGKTYWSGVRATGHAPAFMAGAGKPSYRVDLMTLRGDEDVATIAGGVITGIDRKDVAGWGFDAATDIPLPNMRPILHLGYAFGSGDDNAADNTDHGFHQNALKGNFSRIGALSENTDNYGTVLRPQLANIHVLSAGFTMPVLEASNAGILYRYYRLDETATSLTDSGVFNTLNGVDDDLGQGLDLLFNMNVLAERQMNMARVQEISFRSSLGFFRSGDAYGAAEGEMAVRGLVELKVGF